MHSTGNDGIVEVGALSPEETNHARLVVIGVVRKMFGNIVQTINWGKHHPLQAREIQCFSLLPLLASEVVGWQNPISSEAADSNNERLGRHR